MREHTTGASDARGRRGADPARAAAPARDPVPGERAAHSTFRALQAAPLARLAANGTEHAHVRAVAILGYN